MLQSDLESILIFAALGFGMAFPWLMLTLVPVWVKLLPKPGAWMVTFKRIHGNPDDRGHDLALLGALASG